MTSNDDKKGLLGRLLSGLPLFGQPSEANGPPRQDVPWMEPVVPLREATVALVTTGGVYLQTDLPFDIDDPEGDPGYREIPVEAAKDLLRITPYYYDSSDAREDINLVLPIQRLQEFKAAGVIGNLHSIAYSLMGQVSGSHIQELQLNTSLEIARDLVAAGVDYALLIAACGSCNRSAGLVARVVEAAGIATVCLSSSLEITNQVLPPRALYFPFPFGHPLGEPGNRNMQCDVLYRAFRLLFEAREPGTVHDSGLRWKRERYLAPEWDVMKKLGPPGQTALL